MVFALSREDSNLFRFFQHALSLMDDLLPDRRQFDPVLVPIKYRQAQLFLQLLDRKTQGRLCDKD
jgi:hypothetical protein